MKNTAALCAISLLLLTSCASYPTAPYRVGVSESDGSGQTARVWADNTAEAAMHIKRVDGKSIQSLVASAPYYAIATTPGAHALSVHFSQLSRNIFLQGSTHADVDLQAELQAGHDYALRHQIVGDSVRLHLVDLGVDQACTYVVTGKMQQGYVPVSLVCR